jgi:hypothetical protein
MQIQYECDGTLSMQLADGTTLDITDLPTGTTTLSLSTQSSVNSRQPVTHGETGEPVVRHRGTGEKVSPQQPHPLPATRAESAQSAGPQQPRR